MVIKKRHSFWPDRPFVPPTTANWEDVDLSSSNLRGKSYLELDGYRFCTQGEFDLACLLKEWGVEFIPDVRFDLLDTDPGSARSRTVYVPDFILGGKRWIFRDEEGNEILVHGLEVKARLSESREKRRLGLPISRMLKKMFLLCQQYGIVVVVVSDGEVERWRKTGFRALHPIEV